MALWKTWVEFDFTDAAERTATVRYLLPRYYDTVTPNMPAILADVATLRSAIQTLTWSGLSYGRLILEDPSAPSSANVAANNQIRAFIRVLDSGGNKASIEIPAWDDAVYDQNSNNILSPAFQVLAGDVTGELLNPDTELPLNDTIEYAQSRTRKSRNVLHD